MPHGIEEREEGLKSGYLFVIAVEGAKDERVYFEQFHEQKIAGGRTVRVDVLAGSDGRSRPEDVLERMDKRVRENLKPSDTGDELWLVFDVDHHSKEAIQTTADKAEAASYQMAISNPCFEIWLYWLLSDYPEEKAQTLRDLAQRRRSQQMKIDYQALKRSLRQPENPTDAITRAKARDTNASTLYPDLPGTRVYLLMERLLY